MKKFAAFFVLLTLLAAPVAHADIFGERPRPKLKAGANAYNTASATYVDPGTILDHLAAVMGYLGTREGVFYDFNREEFGNYLAATLYTIPDTGIAFNIGALNLDGMAATVDWNVGAAIPADDVPVMAFIKYLYVGAGVGYRDVDNEGWEFSPIASAQFKFTF